MRATLIDPLRVGAITAMILFSIVNAAPVGDSLVDRLSPEKARILRNAENMYSSALDLHHEDATNELYMYLGKVREGSGPYLDEEDEAQYFAAVERQKGAEEAKSVLQEMEKNPKRIATPAEEENIKNFFDAMNSGEYEADSRYVKKMGYVMDIQVRRMAGFTKSIESYKDASTEAEKIFEDFKPGGKMTEEQLKALSKLGGRSAAMELGKAVETNTPTLKNMLFLRSLLERKDISKAKFDEMGNAEDQADLKAEFNKWDSSTKAKVEWNRLAATGPSEDVLERRGDALAQVGLDEGSFRPIESQDISIAAEDSGTFAKGLKSMVKAGKTEMKNSLETFERTQKGIEGARYLERDDRVYEAERAKYAKIQKEFDLEQSSRKQAVEDARHLKRGERERRARERESDWSDDDGLNFPGGGEEQEQAMREVDEIADAANERRLAKAREAGKLRDLRMEDHSGGEWDHFKSFFEEDVDKVH